MSPRQLGQSSLAIAPLAFGGNVFGWSVDEGLAFELLDAFVDTGFNLIDTADTYASWVPGNRGGESEAIIGKWLNRSGKRDKVLIATKVAKWNQQPGLSPINIREAVEGSLKRLQTDHIDLYQAHEDDATVPLADTLGEFTRLVEEGKVRSIGASNYGADRFADALKISRQSNLARYESLQPKYNLIDRQEYERQYDSLVRGEQVGVITYYSLAHGFLTGKYRSKADLAKSAARGGAVERFLNPHGWGVLAALDDVASAHAATPAQVALAWLIARPGITAAIASATSTQQWQELAKSLDLRLDAEEIARLDAASNV